MINDNVNRKVLKSKLKSLIEPHFHTQLPNNEYSVKSVSAKKLMVYSRFDLAFKLLYLKLRFLSPLFAKTLYLKHISAFTQGSFKEPGNDLKNSPDRFISEFDHIFKNIQNRGFDSENSIIPLTANGTIANGAHRVASAIVLNKKVSCVNIDTIHYIYDYDFFKSRGVSNTDLDYAAQAFVECANNVYIAILWPSSNVKEGEIERLIPNIIYKKSVHLNKVGAHHLISQVYWGESWLGSYQDKFSGAEVKLLQCFRNFEAFYAIAFQSSSIEAVIKIKNNVRNFYSMNNDSIHITDCKDESISLANVIFNDDSIYFMNNAALYEGLDQHKVIDALKLWLSKQRIDNNDILLCKDSVFFLLGVKKIDKLSIFVSKATYKKFRVNFDSYPGIYVTINDQIYDPSTFYYFKGLKVQSLNCRYSD